MKASCVISRTSTSSQLCPRLGRRMAEVVPLLYCLAFAWVLCQSRGETMSLLPSSSHVIDSLDDHAGLRPQCCGTAVS